MKQIKNIIFHLINFLSLFNGILMENLPKITKFFSDLGLNSSHLIKLL